MVSPVCTTRTSLHNAEDSQDSKTKLFTCAEIQDAARRIGMEISLSTLGPFYRTVIRLATKDEADPKGKIIGFTSGTITAPLLRQDTMKIYGVNTGNQLSRKEAQKNTRGWTSPTTFGLSLLLGAYGGRYAYDQGCTKAELLAINDNERQHTILQRHYQRLGLKPVREVTEDLSCIPGTSTHLYLALSCLMCWACRPHRMGRCRHAYGGRHRRAHGAACRPNPPSRSLSHAAGRIPRSAGDMLQHGRPWPGPTQSAEQRATRCGHAKPASGPGMLGPRQ